jgi:four helix bundle protein
MSMQKFQDSIGWQKAMDLCEAVDIALEGNRNWGFKDQLFRASLSICNNLAEGFEMPTTSNQLRYLWIAKGSCNEVISMLHLTKRRKYFKDGDVDRMLALSDEVSRLLRTYIDGKSKQWRRFPGGAGLLALWLSLTTLHIVR